MSIDPSKVKAVIFDMDGVLFHSSHCHEQAYNETLRSIGIDNYSYRHLAGMRTNEAIRKALQERGKDISENEIERLVKDKQTRAQRLLTESASIALGADAILRKLKRNFQLALASSASWGTVETYLKLSGHERFFSVCLDGSAVTEAKPSPEIYLLAAQKLKVPAESCVVIEDAQNGVAAAIAAHMPVIAIVGTDSAKALQQAGASAVISSLQEIELLLLRKDADSRSKNRR